MIAGTRQLVHDTWALAWPARDVQARHVYARPCEIDPDASRLSTATDIVAPRRKFTDMLAAIVRAIEEPDELVPVSSALGRRHAGYGVEDRHYDSVGDALLWALGQALGDRYTPEAHAAWHEAYALLSALMRRGTLSVSGAWTAGREGGNR
jgi:hemoglobin-like flavoprotein